MKYSDLKSILYSDLYRHTHGKVSKKIFIKYYFLEAGFKYTFWLRITSYFNQNYKIFLPFRIISRFKLERLKYKFGIEVSPRTKIGMGFYINHFGGIIINSEAVIGHNCNISQGVTIGQSNRGKNIGCPIIGNNVFIGPGAKVFGNIKIGNNVAVGANSVITNDIPDNAVVAGIPGKIISMKGSEGYVENTDYNTSVDSTER